MSDQSKPRPKRVRPSAGRFVELLKELPDNLFQFVQDVTDKITVSKLALVFVASVFMTLSVMLYENRVSLMELAISQFREAPAIDDWDVSQETKVEIVRMVKDSQQINFSVVTQIDLQKNRRKPRFWHLESPQADAVSRKAAAMMPLPVFDDDGKNTSQILSVLNTDFLCTPFEDTIFARHFPELKGEIPVICRMSIPPIFGQFTGILTIGLTRTPTKDEYTAIRQLATELSTRIYMKDIVKRPSLIQAP